jgi:hypothetical protein
MSFYDDSSLVVIPSGYKTSKVYAEKPTDGSGDLAFTRTGDTATRVNSAGLVEKVRTNLILQSQTFDNASWAKSNITVTANTTVAPDGTTTADTFVSLGVTSEHAVRATTSMAVNTEHTASVYVKRTNTRYAYIRDLTNNTVAIYDLQDGVVSLSAGTSTSITAVGSFYRISTTFVTPAVIVNNLIDLGITTSPSSLSSLVPVNDTMVFWGAQLETGVLTDYIPTTTAAVSVGPVANVPRLDYLGSSCPRLLLEPQRQNLVTFSEQINNAAWVQEQVTITANATTSPDGTINADKVIANATAGDKYVAQIFTVGIGNAFTTSAYFKSSEYTYAFIRFGGLVSNPYVIYNLATQAVVTTSGLTSSSITSVGNGWYRITATVTSTTTTIAPVLMVIPSTGYTLGADNIPEFTGNGTSGGFIWGAQLEAGAYATSYIPTLSASATRGADAASKTGISSLIGQTEGTLFMDVNKTLRTDSPVRLNISDGTASNWIFIGLQTDNSPILYVITAGSTVANITSIALSSGRHKIAGAYKNNDFVLYVDGVQIGTDTSGGVGATSRFQYGGNYIDTGAETDSLTNQILLFKTRLTNAELATLTTL